MPAPVILNPLTWKLLQLGTVAAISWYTARKTRNDGPRDIWREQALNDVAEGVEVDYARAPGAARADGAARFRRTVRFGAEGPGVDVDASGLARLKLRRVRRGD